MDAVGASAKMRCSYPQDKRQRHPLSEMCNRRLFEAQGLWPLRVNGHRPLEQSVLVASVPSLAHDMFARALHLALTLARLKEESVIRRIDAAAAARRLEGPSRQQVARPLRRRNLGLMSTSSSVAEAG